MAEKYGATRFIKTHHKLLRSVWNETTKKWTLELERTDTGEVFREEGVDVVIAARGLLNEPSWPDISGLERFKGKLMHSAEWDEQYVVVFLLLIALLRTHWLTCICCLPTLPDMTFETKR